MDGLTPPVSLVRSAVHADVPAIVSMSRKFYATTSYAGFAPMDDESVGKLADFLIGTGVMLVAEVDGHVRGMVGLAVTPFMFNHQLKSAHEVVWWVDPAAQGMGLGRQLLAAVEPACRDAGVKAIQMIHLPASPPQAAALYERAGYRHSETSYTKEVD